MLLVRSQSGQERGHGEAAVRSRGEARSGAVCRIAASSSAARRLTGLDAGRATDDNLRRALPHLPELGLDPRHGYAWLRAAGYSDPFGSTPTMSLSTSM